MISRVLAAAAFTCTAALQVSAVSRPEAWPCVWTAPPKGTPSVTWPDGPILGNGNIGVTFGGSDGVITAYMTVNGFWGINTGNRSTTNPRGFPGCPAENCTVPVGMVIGGMSWTVPQVQGGSWSAVQWLDNATVRVTLSPPAGSSSPSFTLTAWASATSQLVGYSMAAQGGAAGQALTVNVTTWANDNVLNVPIEYGCTDSSTGAPNACPAAGQPLQGAWLIKTATIVEGSPLPINGSIAWVPVVQGVQTLNTSVMSVVVPTWYWVTNEATATHTLGITTIFSLPQGQHVDMVATAAASRDPGVYPQDLLTVVQGRLAGANPSAFASLYQAHTSWWAQYWAASGVALDPLQASVEGYWYSALYALGSGSKDGQLVMDLWSPWRTTDAPDWRSNPTMDYNQEALYSGIFSANHAELAPPYYDFIDAQLAGGQPQNESALLGCPGGVHFSVDFSNWGLKFGVVGTPGNWGIFTNAAYAAMTYVYQYYTTPVNATWIEARAWPFMSQVATFWQCRLVKTTVPTTINPDGYQYWDVDDCTGDEGCSLPAQERTNPMWGVVFIRRLLETLVDMAPQVGRPVEPQWVDILTHWPAIPTTLYTPSGQSTPVPVLAWYGQSNFTMFSKQANELMALWPGELLSLSEPNATLLQAAQNTLTHQNWGQSNSFSWIYSAAARAGLPPTTILGNWANEASKALVRPNRLVAFGGLCSDSLGAIVFVHDLLVQGQEGFLRLFPAWPGEQDAAFAQLRMKGAFLVSASYVGTPAWAGQVAGLTGGAQWVSVLSEAGGNATVLSPWPAAGQGAAAVCDVTTSYPNTPSSCSALPALPLAWSTVGGMNGGPALSWLTHAGHAYLVAPSQAVTGA